jgi:hypothetical protein
MNLGHRLFIVIIVCLLFSCAPSQQQATRVDAPPAVVVPTIDVTDLPCAEIDNAETLTILYATESLYSNGAVFPGQEGLACLEVLASWLKSTTRKTFLVTVSGEKDTGFDPGKIAGKRMELLQRYFSRQGVDTSGWTWQAAVTEGLQLKVKDLP